MKEVKKHVGHLVRLGASQGDRVVLSLENGFNAICSQMACSVVGAVFIPVNPNEPRIRLLEAIWQYRPKFILINNESQVSSNLPGFVAKVNLIDLKHDDPVDGDHPILESTLDDSELLYIISTSGTTGSPKGIMMSHRATIAFFEAIVSHCKLTPLDNVGSISPLQFDFSLLDLGLAWGSQAVLTVFPHDLAYAPKKLLKEMVRQGISHLDCVPAIWTALLRYCINELSEMKSLKSILYAGDRFPLANMETLWTIFPKLKVINCFGQSESIACSFFDLYPNSLLADNEVSIGNGYGNSAFYIVDEDEKLVTADGMPGELWLSNDSLFNGYWENPVLNEEKLVADPFSPSNRRKVFKTGDVLFRKLDRFYFLGRKDNQIKVNGNRVELDEIEQIVARMEGVSEVVAIGKAKNGIMLISLYVSVKAPVNISEESIRKCCRVNLPIYMIPNEILLSRLPFPVNSNGKVDKKKLVDDFCKLPV